MIKKTIISLAVVAVLGGCAAGSGLNKAITGEQFDAPKVEELNYLKKKENALRPPSGGPIAVAVYNFRDLTGQRKATPNIASLSSAVTQGADSYLVKALQEVGDRRWFIVLERVGLENLIKERQMIRQMREQYQGKDAKPLPPMLFAGIILEGGIVGYDSNTLTGGSGMRLFGIGASTQYQSDTVTINIRAVSVSTGEVLTSVTVTKTVLSYMDKLTVLRFIGDGTALGANATSLEGEIGGSINESINKAVDLAVQAAVVDTIREGVRKGHWAFREEPKPETKIEVKPEIKTEPKAEVKPEIKPETKPEPKAEVKPEVKPEPTIEKPQVEIKKQAVVVDWVNIRKTKEHNSNKLAKVSPGTTVEILNQTGAHVLIKHGEIEGWILKQFIKEGAQKK